MDDTGTTNITSTARRNRCDALDFISVGDNDSDDIEGVRLLCVILNRATCEVRIRRAELLLAGKLSNAINVSFVTALPGGEDILARIALRP